MSGGHFDYNQFQIETIADSVEEIISRRGSESYYNWTSETMVELYTGLELLRKASIYAQRINWLVSGDDDQETFHRRLKSDLEELERKSNGNV